MNFYHLNEQICNEAWWPKAFQMSKPRWQQYLSYIKDPIATKKITSADNEEIEQLKTLPPAEQKYIENLLRTSNLDLRGALDQMGQTKKFATWPAMIAQYQQQVGA